MAVTARFRADRVPLISLFVSTEKTRYYLHGFCVERHPVAGVLLIATDGHRMAIFHDAEGYLEGAAQIIVKANAASLKACKPPRGQVVDSWWCQVEGATAKSSDSVLQIGFSADCGATITRPDATQHDCLIDGTFPDYRRVLPSDNAPADWSGKRLPSFNPDYLASFGKVSASEGGKKMIAIHPSISEGPAIISTGRADFFGVLMPMRSALTHDRPDWLNAFVAG